VNWNKRPLAVTILAWLYTGIGAGGFVSSHLADGVWVELVELLAVISGAFMLRGHNWARWLALAWIAFHAIVSAFHTSREFAVHCVFCAVINWSLLRPEAARYFQGRRIEAE
jgi:hypothetical protein